MEGSVVALLESYMAVKCAVLWRFLCQSAAHHLHAGAFIFLGNTPPRTLLISMLVFIPVVLLVTVSK